MENKIIDESGDKSFFTIIPNYILNHSSDTDQSLYMQMKKVSGENGECYVTEQHLCEKMRIGRKKFLKSLKYLLEHEWITFVGKSHGKTRPVNTYKINNIWKLNGDYYEEQKITFKSTVSTEEHKDNVQKKKDNIQKHSKITSKRYNEEDPILRRFNKEDDEEQNFINKKTNPLILSKSQQISYLKAFPGLSTSELKEEMGKCNTYMGMSSEQIKNPGLFLRKWLIKYMSERALKRENERKLTKEREAMEGLPEEQRLLNLERIKQLRELTPLKHL